VKTPGSNVNWSTPKLTEALNSLDEAQRPAFRQLVEASVYHAARRGWHPVRQWQVLADLVRDGWRQVV
jgi:hypothetical protein